MPAEQQKGFLDTAIDFLTGKSKKEAEAAAAAAEAKAMAEAEAAAAAAASAAQDAVNTATSAAQSTLDSVEASAAVTDQQLLDELKAQLDAERKAQEEASLAKQQAEAAAAAAATTTYTIVAGDSLWAIANKLLGDGSRWPELYEANKDVIGANPNLIHPGQVLTIPK